MKGTTVKLKRKKVTGTVVDMIYYNLVREFTVAIPKGLRIKRIIVEHEPIGEMLPDSVPLELEVGKK